MARTPADEPVDTPGLTGGLGVPADVDLSPVAAQEMEDPWLESPDVDDDPPDNIGSLQRQRLAGPVPKNDTPSKPIEVRSADGKKHTFPADTAQDVIDSAMKKYAEQRRDKSTFAGQAAAGFMDPLEGGGQIVANVLPSAATNPLNAFNNWLAENAPGVIRKLPAGGKNQQVREREAAIEAERGQNSKDIDWGRMTGNMLNPINYIGAGVLSGPGKLRTIGNTAIGGTMGGLMSPATKDDYALEKAEQGGLGTLLGTGFGIAGVGAAKGVEKIGEYVARNYPDNIMSQAVQTVMRRINQDAKASGVTAEDAIDIVNSSVKPLTLADVAGENTKALGGRVYRQGGEAKSHISEFLKVRDEEAAARLTADIGQYLHGGPTMHQAADVLYQARSAAARPAYDAAHDLKNIWSPRLAEFLEDPAIQKGLNKGYELERMISLAEGRPLKASQLGVDIDLQGNLSKVDAPNMRLLDMAKQGLDAMISEQRDIAGRLSKEGVALSKLKDAYVKTIDDLDTSGLYKKARAEWAGYSQSIDSLKLGRAAFHASPEENAAVLAKMSDGDKQFYRMGLADLLKERLLKTGISGDEAKALIKNQWTKEQMRPAFRSDKDFDKFVSSVTSEMEMYGTQGKVARGSATAERGAEDVAPAGGKLFEAASIGKDIIKGRLFSAAKNAVQFYRDIGVVPSPEVNAKIAQILFSENIPVATAAQLTGKTPIQKFNPLDSASRNIQFTTKVGGSALGVGAGSSLEEMAGGRDLKKLVSP